MKSIVKYILLLLALVTVTQRANAYSQHLYEISGPSDVSNCCYGDTYTLNGVTYQIYAYCETYGSYAGLPDMPNPLKFVAFVKSLRGVTTEECVIPATFEDTHISFPIGSVVINNIVSYKYVFTTNPNFPSPESGGNAATQMSPTVEVWGFSSRMSDETNSNIKTLRFEGNMSGKAEDVYVYDDNATTVGWQTNPGIDRVYWYKKASYTDGNGKFTTAYKPSLPNLERLYINTLSDYGTYNNLSKFPNLANVHFTSTGLFQSTIPVFTGVSNMNVHLTNEAFASYVPDGMNSYFNGFKNVFPESFNVELAVENGAWVKMNETDYHQGQYSVTVEVGDDVPSFLTYDAIGRREWVNGKEVTREMEYAGVPFNDMEGYEYRFTNLRPTMYVRCTADEKIIEFNSIDIQRICIANWDINEDGYFTTSEAANVTSLQVSGTSPFGANEDFVEFDELQYFTNLRSISNSAFADCSAMESVVLPPSVTSIGQNAFFGCTNLREITIPTRVTSIGVSAFSDCDSLNSIVVDKGNSIYSSPHDCNAIIWNDTLLVAGCKNTRIPEGVKTIGRQAFYDISSLTSIELPTSLNSIGASAFQECTNLSSVVSYIRQPFTLNSSAFRNIASNCVLTVPYGTRDAYIAAGWTTNIFKGGIMEDKSKYDTNSDGSVTIADVTTLVNVILGK